jgi:multiple antibiotic resistance protein
MLQNLINDFITLFVAIDAIGTVPLVVALLGRMDKSEQRRIVIKAVLVASGVLAGFALFGHVLLASMGVSFASFRIAGGLVLFIVGARMIFEDHDTQHKSTNTNEAGRDLAVFPLAMPYMAGPATTLAVMVATQQEVFHIEVLMAKILVLALVMGVSLLILLSATRIDRLIGRTGSQILGRVMGILLAALAAESVVRGIYETVQRGGVAF